MVRIALLLVAILPTAALAISPDELRGVADDKNREQAARNSRANTGSMGDLLPGKPKSSKYGSGSPAPKQASAKRRAASESAPATAPVAPVRSDDIYIPPPREGGTDGGGTIVSDAVMPSVAFGIRMGTWLTAKLHRKTSSAETGTVEVEIVEDVIGDRRTLPAGSTLFVEKALNATTKRMEGVATKGITPRGDEFELRGLVFDTQRQPGLAGVYVIDKKESVAKGASKGALAAVGALTSSVAPGPVGSGMNAATQSMLNDAEEVTDNNAPQAVIYVSPQTMLIRVERQF